MTFQLVVVVFGAVAFAALLLAAWRGGPRPGEWHGDVDGDDRRRARWRARSSDGFSDRGASGGA